MPRTPLPAPTVDASPAAERDPSAAPGSIDVVISRDGKARSYRAEGGSTAELVKDAVRKVIGDAHTAEWLP